MTEDINTSNSIKKRLVGFVPELQLKKSFTRKLKLAHDLCILPESDYRSVKLRKELIEAGYKIDKGSYLYFEGYLKKDGTGYEIFLGYCLALTFYYSDKRASCRAIKDIDSEKNVELFIDAQDKFRYELADVIDLKTADRKKILPVFQRIEAQLETPDFNPLRNSIDFFKLFMTEPLIRTRILYLSICLESIYIDEAVEGASYKLAVRCAHFLHNFNKKMAVLSVFEEVKNGYALRSAIIHGDDYRKASSKIINKSHKTTELDHISPLENIVKNTLSLIFLNKSLYEQSCKGSLGAFIDESFVLHS